MKILFLNYFILLTTLSFAQFKDHCTLRGVVYLEKHSRNADYLVYLENSEAFADILIFKEENKLFADKPGLWHFGNKKNFSDFSIFFTKDRPEAAFSIYYIDSPTFAGCQ